MRRERIVDENDERNSKEKEKNSFESIKFMRIERKPKKERKETQEKRKILIKRKTPLRFYRFSEIPLNHSLQSINFPSFL